MPVTMKLPLQSTTARQFKFFFFIIIIFRSLCMLKFGGDIFTCQEDGISQKAFGERIVRDLLLFIKEEPEHDVTLIPGQI